MGFWDRNTTFAGKKIVEFNLGDSLPDPDSSAPRISVEYDDADNVANEKLTEILQAPNADQLTALVIGPWGSEMFEAPPNNVLELIVAAAPQLPNLKAIFWGDITAEECEISWIQQTNLSALLGAFPQLEHLRIRGGNNLSLGTIKHDHLETLIIETGGLGRDVLEEIAAAKLPSLKHLELFLGDEGYGWDGSVDDVRPLISTELFPNLTYLGLCNAEISDDIAELIAQTEIFTQLETLDLSRGTLGDRGANALLESGKLAQLSKLNLSYHYISEAVAAKFEELGIQVDLGEPQGASAEDDRYVSVGE